MRQALCLALAKYAGQTITRELAIQLVADLFPDKSHDPAKFGSQQCGSLTFQAERLSGIVDEMEVLHQAHWNESGHNQEGLALNMDYESLLQDERAGRLVQFTVRNDGRLVGNFRLYLCVSRHTQTPFAKEDTLYVVPEHRGGRTALRLLEFAKKSLMSLGYREFRADARVYTSVGRLLEHCGFKPLATEYILFVKESPDA